MSGNIFPPVVFDFGAYRISIMNIQLLDLFSFKTKMIFFSLRQYDITMYQWARLQFLRLWRHILLLISVSV